MAEGAFKSHILKEGDLGDTRPLYIQETGFSGLRIAQQISEYKPADAFSSILPAHCKLRYISRLSVDDAVTGRLTTAPYDRVIKSIRQRVDGIDRILP